MIKPFLISLAATICVSIAIAGYNISNTKMSSFGSNAGSTPASAATPKPVPKPKSTPDPLGKFRAVQQVPDWAKKRVITKVPLKPGQKLFALTFDDGPWPKFTEAILEILAEYDAKATFYMVGDVVRSHPKIARKVRDGGHAVGNHSWSHPSRPRNPVAEVQKTNAEIKKVLGVLPSTFRPPYGILKNGLAKQANKDNMPVVNWSADSGDWRRPSAEKIASRVLRQASPGGIALMHDGGGPRSRTVQALPIIIRGLQDRGYRLVTVPELLKARYVAPVKPKAKSKPKPKPKEKPLSKPRPTASKTPAQSPTPTPAR